MKVSEILFNLALRWENLEYRLPHITSLFNQFLDIRKRPIVHRKSSLQELRDHIREHLDYMTYDYSDTQLADWVNQAHVELIERYYD